MFLECPEEESKIDEHLKIACLFKLSLCLHWL